MAARRLVPLLALFLVLLPSVLGAAEPSLEPFLGKWSGVGVSEKYLEAGYFTYTERDLDMSVTKTEEGFELTWTTGMRPEGSDGPVTVRKTTTLTFKETEPGVFEADAPPPWVKSYRWARLVDKSLVVYIFEVRPTGFYEISRYVRTITAPGEMELGFTRDLDGRPVRQVTGQLSRVAE